MEKVLRLLENITEFWRGQTRMEQTFAAKRYRSELTAEALQLAVDYVLVLMDKIIVGNLLGEQALAALSLVTPMFSLVLFVSLMMSLGTSTMITFEIGRGDCDRANEYLSTGMTFAVISSAALGVFFWLCRAAVMSYFGASGGQLYGDTMVCFGILCFLPPLHAVRTMLYDTALDEGEDGMCFRAVVIMLAAKAGISIVLIKFIGIAGASIGTVASTGLEALYLRRLFKREHNRLHISRRVKINELMRIAGASIGAASTHLFMAIFAAVMNAYLLVSWGSMAVVVLSVVMTIVNLLYTVLSAVGNATKVMVGIYRGENNAHGLAKTIGAARQFSVLGGAAVTAGALILGSLIPSMLGVTDPAAAPQAANAVRIYSLCAIPFALLLTYSSYYGYTGRIGLSVGVSVIFQLIAPLALSIALGQWLGIYGVWLGLSGSVFLSQFLCRMFVKKKYAGLTFPALLDPEALGRDLTYDVPETQDGVMSLVDSLERDMPARGAGKRVTNRAMLVTEETEMAAVRRGADEKDLVECSVLFSEGGVTLILRDTAHYLDLTDADRPVESLEEYAAVEILNAQEEAAFIPTASHNRTILHWEDDGT